MATSASQSPVGRSFLICASTVVLAAIAVGMLPASLRVGAGLGVGTAALSSALTLGFLQLTWRRALKQVIASLAVGFLLRMVMVAAGLLTALHLGAEPLAFAAAFFGLYLVHQTVEIGMLARRESAARVEGEA
jgi:hypothetical protein